MAEQAQVRSVEALESLRAAVLIYHSKSRRAVDMALEDMTRLRQQVEGEYRTHWEAQIRSWNRKLEQARAELMTVRLSSMVDRSTRHEEAVRKAERALAHATEKLKMTRRWARDFEIAVGPHVRRLESVRDHMVHQLPKAAAWLHQAELTLDAYAESRYATLTGPSLTTDAAPASALDAAPAPTPNDSPA